MFEPYKASSSKAIINRFSFGSNNIKLQGLLAEGGVHTLTGSGSNIVQHLELEGSTNHMPRVEESMMVGTSLSGEESHHHGGPIYPIQDQVIIPEKGMEPVNVCGLRLTGDPVHGEGTPIGRQYERSPSMVYGKVERFGDVREMVGLWESLEQEEEEWQHKEGRRRGGKRVSKRISELLLSFQEGRDEQTEEQPGLDSARISTFSDLPLTTRITHSQFHKSRKSKPNKIVVRRFDARNVCDNEVACDWLTDNILSTNENAGKRKILFEEDNDTNWGRTKRIRPGS